MSARGILGTVCVLRTAYGAASLFAPDAMAKAARVPPPEPDARYFNALFGGRDFSIVAATIGLLRAGREREAVLLNASCEATDALALLQEYRRRGTVDTSVAAGAAFAAVGQSLCIAAARRL